MEVNLNYWFKNQSGIGMRMAAGIDHDHYNNSGWLNPTGSISFLFGWFKE